MSSSYYTPSSVKKWRDEYYREDEALKADRLSEESARGLERGALYAKPRGIRLQDFDELDGKYIGAAAPPRSFWLPFMGILPEFERKFIKARLEREGKKKPRRIPSDFWDTSSVPSVPSAPKKTSSTRTSSFKTPIRFSSWKQRALFTDAEGKRRNPFERPPGL